MSNIFLHLCSTMPAVFCINGEQIGCCENPCRYLDIAVCHEKFVLMVYPVDQIAHSHCSLSYSTQINCTTPKPTANNDLITITDYGQSHYIICAKPLLVPRLNNHPPCYDTCGACSMSIIYNNINVTSEQKNFNFSLKTPLKTAKMQKINDFYAVLGENEQNLNYILVLNKNLQLVFDCWADRIEITENQIVTLDYINDIAQHGKVNEYNFENGNITKHKSYTVYTKNTPTAPANAYAVPYAFLEAITQEDFSLAKSYLHPSLIQALSDHQIRDFFGNFVDATPAFGTDDFFTIALVYQGKPQFTKKYHFEVVSNLIKNIESID